MSVRAQVQLILAQKWDEFMKDFEEPPLAPVSRMSPQRPPLPPRAPKSPARTQVETVQSLPPLVLDLGEFGELSQRQKEGTGESEVVVKLEEDGMEGNQRAGGVVEGGEEESTETLEGPEGECIEDSVAGTADSATERAVIRLGGERGFGAEEQAAAISEGGLVSASREEESPESFVDGDASERLTLIFDAPIAGSNPAEAETDDAPQNSEAPSPKAADNMGDDVMAALAPTALEAVKAPTSKSSSQGKSGFLSTARAWWKGAKTAAPKSEGADGSGTEGLVGGSGIDPEVSREVADSQRVAMAPELRPAMKESADVAGSKVYGEQGSAERSRVDRAVSGGVSETQLLPEVKTPVEGEGSADVAVVDEHSTGTCDGGEENEEGLAGDSSGEASPLNGRESAASRGTERAAPLTPQTLAAKIAKAEAECRVLREKMASAALADVSQVGRVEGAGVVSEEAPEVVTVNSELVEEEGVVEEEELEREVEVDQVVETAPAKVGLLGLGEGVPVQTETPVDVAEGQGLEGGSAGSPEEAAPQTLDVVKVESTGTESLPGVGSAVAESSVELAEVPAETETLELVTEAPNLQKSEGDVLVEGLEEADSVVEGPKEAERVLEEVSKPTAEEITTEQESEYALAVIGGVGMPVEVGGVLPVGETASKPAAETGLLESEVEPPLADVFESTVEYDEPLEEAEKVEALQAQDAPAVEVDGGVRAVRFSEKAEGVADLWGGEMLAHEPPTGGVALGEGSPPAKNVEVAGVGVAAPGKAEEVSVLVGGKSTASEPAWKIFPGWEGAPVQVRALRTVEVPENSEGVREDGRLGSEPAEEVVSLEIPEKDVASVEEVEGDDNPEKAERVSKSKEIERPSSDEKLLALVDDGGNDRIADVRMLTSEVLLGAFEGSEEVEKGNAGFEQGAEETVVGLEEEEGADSGKKKESSDEETLSRETVVGHQMLFEKPDEEGAVLEMKGEEVTIGETVGEETVPADPVEKETAIEMFREEGTGGLKKDSEIAPASHEGGSRLNRGTNRSLETDNPSEFRKDSVGMDEAEAEWGTTIPDVRSNPEAQDERRPSLEPLDANRAPFPAAERVVPPAGGRPQRPEDGFRDENGFEGGVKRQVGSPPEKGLGLRSPADDLFDSQKGADIASVGPELDVENAAPKEETRLYPPVLSQAAPLAARPPSRRGSKLNIETPKPASLGAETAATWAPRFRGLGDAAVASPRTAALQFASLQEEVAELRAHNERAEAEKGAIEKRWKAARKVGAFCGLQYLELSK
jgi:hypothetical protein